MGTMNEGDARRRRRTRPQQSTPTKTTTTTTNNNNDTVMMMSPCSTTTSLSLEDDKAKFSGSETEDYHDDDDHHINGNSNHHHHQHNNSNNQMDDDSFQEFRCPSAAAAASTAKTATATVAISLGGRSSHHRRQKQQQQHRDTITRRKKKRKDKYGGAPDPPFWILVLQVAATLALIAISTHGIYRHFFSGYLNNDAAAGSSSEEDDDNRLSQQQKEEEQLQQEQPEGEGINMDTKSVADWLLHRDEDNMERILPQNKKRGIGVVDEEGEKENDLKAAQNISLPKWNLTDQAQWDAYGLAAKRSFNNNNNHNNISNLRPLDNFWNAAAGLRNQFAEFYGGEDTARAILERGMSTFGEGRGRYKEKKQEEQPKERTTNIPPKDLQETACRILRARSGRSPFRFAFGGYSVTVGRGNYFSQSFPLQMEKLLHTLFKLLNVDLVVDNAAIGGCPAFPYGWCMDNFWGRDPDVVSWDFSMNEAGGDPVGLEGYIRHVLQLPKRPKLIVKDTYLLGEQRRKLLQHYHEPLPIKDDETAKRWKNITLLRDALVLHSDGAAHFFLDLPEEQRPKGFQQWRLFGAPKGAPGQQIHHPALAEHTFLSWILSLHFLSALQLVATHLEAKENIAKQLEPSAQDFILQCSNDVASSILQHPVIEMGPPLTTNASDPWSSLFFGETIPRSGNENNQNRWGMNTIKCRTSFDPIVSGPLADVLIPTTTVGEDVELMLPKSNMFYNKGWVLDLSDAERKAKHNLDRFGGLGFRDSKKAYYGIFTSKALKMLLPYDADLVDISSKKNASGSSTRTALTAIPKAGDVARNWFNSVAICQVNNKPQGGVCEMEMDLTFQIDGQNVTSQSRAIAAAGSLFMGKKICMFLPIPETAKLTTRVERFREKELEISSTTTAANENSGNVRGKAQRHVVQLTLAHQVEDVGKKTDLAASPEDEQVVGLAVDVIVHNPHIMSAAKACSVSHVIWEQHNLAVKREPVS